MAKEIKNKHIIHYVIRTKSGLRYACTRACSITKLKSTKNKEDVTCKNCLNYLKKKC